MILLRRVLLKIISKNRSVVDFLNPLSTNDLNIGQTVYSSILNPDGRFLCDFFIHKVSDFLSYIDIDVNYYDTLLKKIRFYDIRDDFDFEKMYKYSAYWVDKSSMNSDCMKNSFIYFEDTRNTNIGYIVYKENKNNLSFSEESYKKYKKILVDNLVMPSEEFIPCKDIILDYNFEHNNGISFTKGCYLGQELMISMKHKGLIKKKLIKKNIYNPNQFKNGESLFDSDLNKIGRICCIVDDLVLFTSKQKDGQFFNVNKLKLDFIN